MQSFFYLPLMHAEDLVTQDECVKLIGDLEKECENDVNCNEDVRRFVDAQIGAARRHRDVIERFGRFPARNVPMGREATAEESIFLKETPQGF